MEPRETGPSAKQRREGPPGHGAAANGSQSHKRKAHEAAEGGEVAARCGAGRRPSPQRRALLLLPALRPPPAGAASGVSAPHPIAHSSCLHLSRRQRILEERRALPVWAARERLLAEVRAHKVRLAFTLCVCRFSKRVCVLVLSDHLTRI